MTEKGVPNGKIEIEKSKPDYVDKEAIEKSDVFVVIMSKHWVNEPLRIQELEYAKQLHKPIAALVLDGVDATPYLADADVLVKKECSREDSNRCISEMNEIIQTELTRRKLDK